MQGEIMELKVDLAAAEAGQITAEENYKVSGVKHLV
jgi:hypothetical protein